MTDNELAEELEFLAMHGISAAPALQHEASERIRALSAHVALLKASLAHAEREAEKATVSAEPFGYFRVTHARWEDCAATDDGSIPLYTAPQPDRVAELTAEVERLRAGSHRRAVRGGCRSVCAQGKGGRPMLDLDDLEAKAKAATPGPWRCGYEPGFCGELIDPTGEMIASFADEPTARDSDFIAAANPSAVLDLIRELREARAVIAKALSWDDRGTPIRDVLREAVLGEVEQAAADEREACAALCDRIAFSHIGGERCAALIRARGAKGGE